MTDFFKLLIEFATQFGVMPLILFGVAWWFNKKDNQHREDFKQLMLEDKEDRKIREDRYASIANENTRVVTKLITTMDTFIEITKR